VIAGSAERIDQSSTRGCCSQHPLVRFLGCKPCVGPFGPDDQGEDLATGGLRHPGILSVGPLGLEIKACTNLPHAKSPAKQISKGGDFLLLPVFFTSFRSALDKCGRFAHPDGV
jgi:hypothetical protein